MCTMEWNPVVIWVAPSPRSTRVLLRPAFETAHIICRHAALRDFNRNPPNIFSDQGRDGANFTSLLRALRKI